MVRSKTTKDKGGYQVIRKLGAGGSSQVYLATDPGRSRPVALKSLTLGPKTDPIFLEALKNEYFTLTQLHHPHLARVYDLSILDRELLLSEEWVEGPDLLTFSESANLNTLLNLVVQLLRGLDYLHHRGYLHLDLKPENILVTDPDHRGELLLKIIDFGLATSRDKSSIEDSLSGTFPYVAPEVLTGMAPSPASDLYSVAMMLYRIFTGKFPFASQDPAEIFQEQLYSHQTQTYPLHPALPETWGHFLLQVLQKDPKSRPQSAREFLQRLNECLGENYSLKTPHTPLRILKESDFLFYPEAIAQLKKEYFLATDGLWILKGPAGSGKKYLLNKIKESLQLAGAHPLWVTTPEEWDRFKENPEIPGTHLLMLGDAWKAVGSPPPWEELKQWPMPVLITWDEVAPPTAKGTVLLQKCGGNNFANFFSSELIDFPEKWIGLLHKQFGDSLADFSHWLEAAKDLQWFHWSAEGWAWQGSTEIDPMAATKLAQNLWETWWQGIREILHHSTQGLSAKVLAGLINLETKRLRPLLKQWVQQGRLQREFHHESWLYGLKASSFPSTPMPKDDWDWILGQLQELYQQGRYGLATQWLETLHSEQNVPSEVKLWGARHLVALGKAEAALNSLPELPPQQQALLGLYHEVQSRAHLLLGNADACLARCNEAMVAFQKAEDSGGIARIHNLRALLAKRKGQWVQAEDLLNKAVTVALPAQDPNLIASLSMNLANWHFDRGDYAKAQENYQLAMNTLDSERHEHLWSVLQHNWVNFLFHSGKSQVATKACFAWLDHALKHAMKEKQVAALNYLSLLAEQDQATLEQGRYLNQALSLLHSASEISTPHLFPQTLLNRAHWHLSRNKYLPAQLDAEGALDRSTLISHQALQASAHILLGRIYRQRRKPDLKISKQHLDTAYRLIREQQLRQILWEIEFEMGELAIQLKDFAGALSHLNKSDMALDLILKNMNPDYRRYFLRDRKKEKIQAAIAGLRETP